MSTPRLYAYDRDTHTATCRTCWISEVELLPDEAGPWHAGHLGQCTDAPADRPSARILAFLRPGPAASDAALLDAGEDGPSSVDDVRSPSLEWGSSQADVESTTQSFGPTECGGEQ